MSETTEILLGKSAQLATDATSKTIAQMGLTLDSKARRLQISFDLDPTAPANADIIGRFTFDGQPATDTYGVQFQYGTTLNLRVDQVINMQFIKLSSKPAVNFMVDQFRYEQQML